MTSYQAIVNLSVPRRGDVNRETDLVIAGETVDLPDDVAELFLPPKRAVPMIRPAGEASGPVQPYHPRQLSGIAINPRTGRRIGGPGLPPDARPDPPGSSAVQVMEPPEAHEPQPGTETQAVPAQDAVDLPPRTRRPAARAR